MALDPITAGIDLVTSVISRVWPDRTAQEKAQLEAALRADDNYTKLLTAQIAVNAVEAASTDKYVSRARPTTMWICNFILAYNYLVEPVVTFCCNACGYPLPPLPQFNWEAMMPVLMGLLGLGGMRSYERVKGVIPKGK